MKMSILMRRKVSALCWARAGWAGAGLPQSAVRSGAATTSTTSTTDNNITTTTTTMSEEHFDQWEHYNFEEKVVRSRNSGKQRSKLEAALNTNRPSPGGHERKIVTMLRNAERNKRARGGRAKQVGN